MLRATVLIADDEERVLKSLGSILGKKYNVLAAASGAEVRGHMRGGEIDVAVLDYYLLDTDAAELLPELRALPHPPEVIVISGKANTKEAVRCMKLGAYDFKLKPYEVDELFASIANAVEKRRLQLERNRLIERHLENYRIIGDSKPIAALHAQIARYADSQVTVLIRGETGTGKELVARRIHYLSSRAAGPLQVINCVAVPRDLADSELFGHARGAFTGAVRDRAGKVELAEGGTLFLDEIGDMPLDLQARLLRFLENREFERVGENKLRRADVRVVAATHRDLEAAFGDGRFRQDLYFRLNVCTVAVAPLRERHEDIPALVEHFAAVAAAEHNRPAKRFAADALAYLIGRDWPGNVRQLRHAVEQAVVHFPQEEIGAADLRLLQPDAGPDAEETLARAVARAERETILARLAKHGGSTKEAARSLGIHRSSLYRKIESYGIKATE